MIISAIKERFNLEWGSGNIVSVRQIASLLEPWYKNFYFGTIIPRETIRSFTIDLYNTDGHNVNTQFEQTLKKNAL